MQSSNDAEELMSYDRITDSIMWLSDNMALNFTVSLSRKNKDGGRSYYHSEYVYGSDKYGGDMKSIKRNMNFAFVIDVKTNFLAGMLIKPQDVELLTRLMDAKVLPWILMSTAFAVRDDRLVLTAYEPVTYSQENNSITFEPVVYVDENDMEYRAIRMTLMSGDSAVLTADQFMGFYNILRKTDMYAVACSLCTYVKTPPYGVNQFVNKGLGSAPVSYSVGNGSGGNKKNFFGGNKFLENAKSKE